MQQILYNSENLKEEDINRIVKRAKMLIINSNNEILFAHAKHTYFFVGGRLEEGETFEEGIVREVLEETGIDIPLEKREPFFTITYMNRNYPSIGVNTKSIAHYYCMKSDMKPNLEKMKLTEEEKSWKFELIYVDKDKALEELNKSLSVSNNKNVVKDTIEVLKEYLKID